MPLGNDARDFIAGLITGHVKTPLFDTDNAHIGIGDGTAAFAVDQTDLQGDNKFRGNMDVGFPTRLANVLKFKATFGPTEANFAWQEWGVFNADVADTMLNRLVEYNGTKLEGQTWIFEVTLTINIA